MEKDSFNEFRVRFDEAEKCCGGCVYYTGLGCTGMMGPVDGKCAKYMSKRWIEECRENRDAAIRKVAAERLDSYGGLDAYKEWAKGEFRRHIGISEERRCAVECASGLSVEVGNVEDVRYAGNVRSGYLGIDLCVSVDGVEVVDCCLTLEEAERLRLLIDQRIRVAQELRRKR